MHAIFLEIMLRQINFVNIIIFLSSQTVQRAKNTECGRTCTQIFYDISQM